MGAAKPARCYAKYLAEELHEWKAGKRNTDPSRSMDLIAKNLSEADVRAVEAHLKAARDGCTFLFIYAPGETELERTMNVVHRVPFELAHYYRRFAIQVLK